MNENSYTPIKKFIKLLVGGATTFAMLGNLALTGCASATSNLKTMNVGAAAVMSTADDTEERREEPLKDTDSIRQSQGLSKIDEVSAEARVEKVSVRSISPANIAKEIESGYDSSNSTLTHEDREPQTLTEKLLDDYSGGKPQGSSRSQSDGSSSSASSSQKNGSSGDTADKSGRPVIEVEYPDNLVIANVKDAVNVRKEPSEESERVGKLYRDCAGEIIERRDGWTYLKSGKLKGWTKDEFLLFGEEAKREAKAVGNLVATITGDGLRVRKEPTEDAGIWGFVTTGDELNAIEVVDDVWVSVEYEGERGFVYAEFTSLGFVLDDGETMEQIKEREEKEAAQKKKAADSKKGSSSSGKEVKNRGAVPVEASDELLLGALIQCEAGNQPYEGQLAVGAVVMNRVRSGGYPGTVSGVIYASGQFTPAHNGRLNSAINNGVKASCMQAAREAIAGASNVGGATRFRRAGSTQGIVIGDHVFW